MSLSKLEKITQRTKKRVGRGESSGKGKTSGRGMKGQKARGKIPLSFEGGQLPLIKRLPFQRGVGNRRSREKLAVQLSALGVFAADAKVDLESLVEKGIIQVADKAKKIKIVAGKIDKPIHLSLPATKEAKRLIEKVKGTVNA